MFQNTHLMARMRNVIYGLLGFFKTNYNNNRSQARLNCINCIYINKFYCIVIKLY